MAVKATGINWYSDEAVAFPGMKANTTLDVVDTFVVEDEAGLEPGDLVILGTDPEQTVKKATGEITAGALVGIVVHTHKEPAKPYYAKGEAVGVMTFGDIYVSVESDVKAGQFAKVTAGQFNNTGTEVSTIRYMTSANSGDVAVVRIRN